MPTTVDAAGHLDSDLPAEVSFGTLAKTGGKQPQWDATGLTCQATYCHDLDGGGTPAPTWTQTTGMVCGSCHGLPPVTTTSGQTHVTSSLDVCADCHTTVINSAGQIIDAKLHVNGAVDLN
jgi:predicted CxxxxCH...CXXCH cytochrome family protein